MGVPVDAVHFNGKWYRVFVEKTGWRRAKDRCNVLGGHLAVVPDEPTQDFIKQLANGVPLWLGATDEKVEGVWQWIDGTPMTFRAWDEKQPEGARNENFLCIWVSGRWHDSFENEPKVVGFVCEWRRK